MGGETLTHSRQGCCVVMNNSFCANFGRKLAHPVDRKPSQFLLRGLEQGWVGGGNTHQCIPEWGFTCILDIGVSWCRVDYMLRSFVFDTAMFFRVTVLNSLAVDPKVFSLSVLPVHHTLSPVLLVSSQRHVTTPL